MIDHTVTDDVPKSLRIALVEDDPLLRKEMHYHLKQQGFLKK